MNLFNTQRRALWFSAIFLVLLSACKKPEEVIGKDVLPDTDQIGFNIIDTTTMVLYSKKAEGVRTDELSAALIGGYNDFETGLMMASNHFQFRLSSLNVDFGTEENIVVDSVRLFMDYSTYYLGDTNTVLSIDLFELSDDLYLDSTYFSDTSFNYLPTSLLDQPHQLAYSPDKSVVIDGDSIEGGIYFQLKNDIGERIIQQGGQATLSSNEEFVKFLKGFSMICTNTFNTGEGLVVSLNPQNIYSKLYIYYRDTVNADTAMFDLLINENSARVNTMSHDFSMSNAFPFLEDSTLVSDKAWLKTGGGIISVLEFPYLENFKNIDGFTINEAQLELELTDLDSSLKTPASSLLLLAKDEEGNDLIIPDLFEGESFYGGTIVDGKYVFRITEYLNQVLRGTSPNSGLEILTRNSAVTANRSVLLTQNPKLKITYSTF